MKESNRQCLAEQVTVKALYQHLEECEFGADLLASVIYPWEVLGQIHDYIIKTGEKLPRERFEEISEHVWVSRTAKIAPTASITGPCIIDDAAEIRHCAFIRGNVIVGKECVVGNSTELKNVILLKKVQVPHYNYVGDSILGVGSHMGAGSITSNVKSDKTLVAVHLSKETAIDTGLKKFGAMLGDYVEVGCGSVLNPGTVIGAHSNIYPLSSVRGVVPGNAIYKSGSEIANKYENDR